MPSRPNETANDWAAQRYRSDSVTIYPGVDAHACSRCTYWIGVHALMDSNFTVVANFQNTTRLSPGVSVDDSVCAYEGLYSTV